MYRALIGYDCPMYGVICLWLMLQNNAFVEPGAEVETIKGNLLRVVNRPKVVKNCVKMYYGTVLGEQTRDCAGNWKKSLPRNLFTGQFDTKQTQFLKQPRKWPCYWQGFTHTWLKTSDNQWPYQRLRSRNAFFVTSNKVSEKTVEFTIKRLKYVICKIIIIIYMKNKKERKERKKVHHSPLQEKNEPRSQGFFSEGKALATRSQKNTRENGYNCGHSDFRSCLGG